MKKISLFLGLGILITAGILFFTSFSQAYVLPSVYVRDLAINKTEFQSGDTITGSFKIYSAATAVVPGIKYKFQILGGIVNNVPTATYYEETGGDTFVVNPFQAVVKSFSHQLPRGLTGSYLLRIALFNEQGLPLGWEDKNISITGASSFVSLSETYFIIGEGKVDAGLGPTFKSEEIPKIQFKAKNNSSNSFSLTPKIDIYQKTTEPNNLVKSYQADKINFTANSEQVINLDLPKLISPQVYVASIKLFDNDRLASNVINFRWVIAGATANIWQTNTDKTSYKVGDEAKVNVVCTGSPDAATGVGKGIMEISLYDKSGELVGRTRKEIDLDKCDRVSALVGIIKDVDSPIVKTEIIKDGNSLASQQVSLGWSKAPEPTPAGTPLKIPYLWIIIALAVIGLILILIKLLMKKSFSNISNPSDSANPPTPPVAPISILLIPIIALTFFLGVNSVKANVIVVSESYNKPGGENFSVDLTYNQPQHNDDYRKGDGIRFSGKVFAAWCVNSMAKAYLDFYLTDSSGATSSIVKLNQNPIYIGSVSGTGAEISYNLQFTIPNNINITGSARAYIDYTAEFYHWTGKDWVWRGTGWIVAYEHILIVPDSNSEPFVDLKVNNQDSPFNNPVVIEAPATYTLSWESWNSNGCTASSSANDWSGAKNTAGTDILNTSSTNTYTYTITCIGANGPPATDTVAVKVNADPWVDLKVRNLKSSSTDYFDASATSTALLLEEPADYELVWNTRRSNSCTAAGSWSGPKSATGSQSFASTTSGVYEYDITCSGGGPSMTDKVFVNVFGNPKVDLKVNGQEGPVVVAKNEIYTLSWQTWNVNSCAESGSWSGNPNPISAGSSTGSQSSTGNYSYKLNCNGNLGNASDTVVVQVKALPECDFKSSPTRVPKNSTSTLTWDCLDVSACNITNSSNASEWILTIFSGSTSTFPLIQPTVFTLTCSNSTDTGSWRAMVGVSGMPNWWEVKP